MKMQELCSILKSKLFFPKQFDKIAAYDKLFFHFRMKFHTATLWNISAEIGKIVNLRQDFYIANGINHVGSYDTFPY